MATISLDFDRSNNGSGDTASKARASGLSQVLTRAVEFVFGALCVLFGVRGRGGAGQIIAIVGGGMMFHAASQLFMEQAGAREANRDDRRGRSREQARAIGTPPITAPATPHRPDAQIENNPVDEASWESFPASDPPAWSSSVAMPAQH